MTFLLSLCFLSAAGQDFVESFPYASPAEAAMIKSWVNDRELGVDLVTAILVSEGLADEEKQQSFHKQLKSVVAELGPSVSSGKADKSGKAIYKHLHKKFLYTYQPTARFKDVLNLGATYNCVSSTSIFAVLCQKMGVPVSLYVTPNHVYAAVTSGSKEIRVEMTDPKSGFNFKTGIKASLRYLRQYKLVTEQEIKEKGERQVYRDFVESGRKIPLEYLLAISYYNQGQRHLVNNRFEKGVHAVSKSLFVNPGDKQAQGLLQKGILGSFQSYEIGAAPLSRLGQLVATAVHFFDYDPEFLNGVLDRLLYVLNTYHMGGETDGDDLKSFLENVGRQLGDYDLLVRKVNSFKRRL